MFINTRILLKNEKKEKETFIPGNEWVEEMRTRIETVISEPAKKNNMLSIVKETERDLLELDRVIQKFYADMGKLKDNYGASREDFARAISEFEAERKIVGQRIIDKRFQMRDLSTPEEWQRLTGWRQ